MPKLSRLTAGIKIVLVIEVAAEKQKLPEAQNSIVVLAIFSGPSGLNKR